MRIATVAIYVDDQPRALKFWTDQVGFTVRRRKPMGPNAEWIELGPRDADACVVIYPKSLMRDWAERKPSVVFECDDVQAQFTAMASRGVVFTQPPQDMPWGPFAIFVDPEGNSFGLRRRER